MQKKLQPLCERLEGHNPVFGLEARVWKHSATRVAVQGATFAILARMGKARREEKLAKRTYQQAVTDSKKPQKFDWKRYFRLLGRTLPRILLLFALTIALQLVLSYYKVEFFTSGIGQFLLFIPMYVMTFVWTQQVAKEFRKEEPLPVKPDFKKR
jgi:hypothetical protein